MQRRLQDDPPFGTKDGVPPAFEVACDPLKDDQKAYGLCVSYCEAKDCDFEDAPGCDKVKANFIELTGKPAMPCDCPCLDGIAGYADALLSVDDGEGQCFLTNSGFEGIVLNSGLVPGAQSIPNVIGFCGFAFNTGPFLEITPQEADNCNALVVDAYERNSLSACP